MRFFTYKLCKVSIGQKPPLSTKQASNCSHSTVLTWAGGGTLKKVNFQQIFGNTFLPLLPLSAVLKHYGLPVLTSMPFESLSRRRGWNASPTKPWLMFKEKIMEMQRQDHTRENQKCFYYCRICLNNILDVHVLQ